MGSPSERAKAVWSFLLQCFPVMEIPNTIKTDNEPAYTRKTFLFFVMSGRFSMLQEYLIIRKDKQ